MPLMSRKNHNAMFCVTHQEEFKVEMLDWFKDENQQQHLMCPHCLEDLGNAEFAKVAAEVATCTMHDGSSQLCKLAPSVGSCTACGQSFCADCLTAASICIFCAPLPVA